jgi:hypothetical protein
MKQQAHKASPPKILDDKHLAQARGAGLEIEVAVGLGVVSTVVDPNDPTRALVDNAAAACDEVGGGSGSGSGSSGW